MTDKKPRGRAKGSPRPEGAGRKKTKVARRSYRFAPDVAAILDKQPDQTAYIEKAVVYYFNQITVK